MKTIEGRVYVVTPTRGSFLHWCELNNHHPNESKLTHIYAPIQLLGRWFTESDKFFYFYREGFSLKVLKEIMHEINLRRSKA